MQNNPAEQWRQLTETYRAMFDGELENLARDLDDLTETAREVLRGEMKSRGLALPGDKSQPGRPHLASKVDPGAFTGEWRAPSRPTRAGTGFARPAASSGAIRFDPRPMPTVH
jgi:hypothetical protein